MSVFKVANIQMTVVEDKQKNLDRAAYWMDQLPGVDFVLLPEMFNCPYDMRGLDRYAEFEEGSETLAFCAKLAKKHSCYLIAGSIPEKDREGHLYNTAYVFDRQGRQIGKARKTHMFDIELKEGKHFRESDTLTPGDWVETFDTEFGVMGLCICYDYRFPEISRIMVNRGAVAVFCPAEFNMITGPAHWELMHRSRSVDNQVFTIATATARDSVAGFRSWGHSLVVDPWGQVLNILDEQEAIQVTECDTAALDAARKKLPLIKHLRPDLYEKEKVRKMS